MAKLSNLCCYCSSSDEVSPSHLAAAAELGQLSAERGIGIIYGAGGVGLMGSLARAARASGGQVVGVIPQLIENWEKGLKEITEYIVVDDMHTRKALMMERADAFCALPGGIGTLEELFEVITWRELGIHDKPIVLLNNDGFWEPLVGFLEQLYDGRFLRSPTDKMFYLADSPADVFQRIEAAPEPRVPDALEQL